MFKVTPDPTFPAQVKIPVPGGEPQILNLEFKFNSLSKLEETQKKVNEGLAKRDSEALKSLLFSLIASWDADMELNEQNFGLLLENYPSAFTRIFVKYVEEITGAKEKN